jgi:transcriptional regulator with XRE-family HTH domain
MKRPTDTFSFQLELGKRLKDLRLRAGLTRAELVQAMGRAGSELVKSLPPDRRPGR